ncbi:E3 ubiquitin-protein ligase RNF166-like [Erpetoichthys calabaricus]|uniref:E3 ubiquitin-protein ligase RNF166 n=1 Tax=Erpetoichthys calabaricus TaxID=27687 RepID=A0A8C4RWM0_ERPCA|nr:E3 ubiquitin-protein ligase RNF166-like [Erpetoichthys calabaricus]
MDAFDIEPGNAEEFECPVCRDVLFDPVSLPCEHVFCHSCLSSSIQTRNHCPTCRGQDTTTVQASDVIARMSYKTATCKTCGVQVPLSLVKNHRAEHDNAGTTQFPFANSEISSANCFEFLTFQCPYCNEDGLNEPSLTWHCNESHRNDTRRVVCPICASMPHGDPSYQSRNFLGHLNLRHSFYVQDFVDISQDDAINEQAILLASYNSCIQ